MKFNKNEFGWKEKVSVNTDELVTKNDIPHYNETLIFEISGDDYRFFNDNSYFNMSALNIDETKTYVGKEINSGEKYSHRFVYDKEADALMCGFVYIYNHKSYNGTSFIEDENSAVLTFDITPMTMTPEYDGYFRLYKVEKLELDNNCLPDNVSIPNSLTVGNRIGDIGEFSVSEGDGNTASGNVSHAEGAYTIASGNISHAEGGYTTASGDFSHAEGDSSIASGEGSHAEGTGSTASGNYSHAENYAIAEGDNSHAEGYWTFASSANQHVQGKFNIKDTTGTYAHIVGNGTSNTKRSNAHTLDWNGNAWYKGKLSQEGTPTEDKDLTTKKYVDDTKFSKNYEDLNNEPFTFLPIKLTETIGSNGTITAYCDVFDLELGHRYVGDFTKYNGICLYTFNSDNTKNTLVATTAYLSTERNGMITVLSSSATKRDILWMSAYGSEQIRIIKNSDETFTITNTLIVPRVTNTREFTPTSNYHLVHKKYVDDAIANQPQISFDTEGNLVVTIGGVTKKFKEITE